MEQCRKCDPPQAENPANRILFLKYHFLEKQDETGYIKANAKTENKRAGRKKILHKKEDKTKMWKQKKGRDTNDFFRLFRNGVCL